ncbi:sulfotransferase family protein [Salinisphaera aquimarina]|uniref:Sulfotransferase family protein n=1 Tax=Salinisphaera aquimarina TaxID=2094031 RepID=A0ABV7EQ23_9GAMM
MNIRAPSPADGQQLILLFGMPRSGTTWLGKLFDSHPHVLYCHEPDHRRVFADSGAADAADRYRLELQTFVAGLPALQSLRVAGKRPLFRKKFMSEFGFQVARLSTEVARAGSRVYPAFPIVVHHDGSGDPERRVVWKSIQSLSSLAPTLTALEKARGIHILRHPCGYIASTLRGVDLKTFSDNSSIGWMAYKSARNAAGTPLGDRFGFGDDHEQMVRDLTPEERLAWHWVLTNEKARMEVGDNTRYLRVRYEDICRDPQAGVQKMFEFAGLEMSDQTQAFIAASTGSSQNDYYSVYKNPSQAAWRWREELDDQTVARVMAIATRSTLGAEYANMTPPEGRPS